MKSLMRAFLVMSLGLCFVSAAFAEKTVYAELTSVEGAPGQELSMEIDPSYIPEELPAYVSYRFLVDIFVKEGGVYLFRFDIPAQDGAREVSFVLEEERRLKPRKHSLEFPFSVKRLQRERGLLWSWVGEREVKAELSVYTLRSAAELVERSSIDYEKLLEELRKREVPEDIVRDIDPSVDPARVVSVLVAKTSLMLDAQPVSRSMARDIRRRPGRRDGPR